MSGVPILMYHELASAGRPLCREDAGYSRYCVARDAFGVQLDRLQANNLQGSSLSAAISGTRDGRRTVAITFDDGCETDLLYAAPLLLGAGFGATFFVVSGWVGRAGYLSLAQLRELMALGFEIGAHSRTHPYLSDLTAAQLRNEICGSKDDLEQWIGEAVSHFSCPGGRWSTAAAAIARDAGFRSVSTSRIGVFSTTSDLWRLPRVPILRGLATADFERVCRGKGLWKDRAKVEILSGVKRVLGNSLYDQARQIALRQ